MSVGFVLLVLALVASLIGAFVLGYVTTDGRGGIHRVNVVSLALAFYFAALLFGNIHP